MNVLLVVAAFWVPGLALGAVVRLRGWVLAAAGPALTFGLVSLGGYVLGKLGIRWDLLSFALWSAAVVAIAGALSLLLVVLARRSGKVAEPEPRLALREHLVVGAGVVAGLLVGAITFLRGIGRLDLINQDWDAPFHGNAVRWIAEHGSVIPGSLGTIANQPDNTTYFYPDTYHALLATLLDKAGLQVPELLNAGALMGVLAWPLGIAALGVAWRLPAIAVGFGAAVSTWFSAFPYDSLWRGPLWPYVAGVALLPAVLAMAKYLLRPKGLAGPFGVAFAVAGLAGLHTSLIFVLFGMFVLLLLAMIFKLEPVDWKAAAPTLVGSAVLAGLFAFPLVLPALANAAGVTSAFWPSEATAAGAFTQMITFSGVAEFPQWWIGFPAFAGILIMIRKRVMLWFVVAYAVFGGLYAMTVSLESPLIHKITGPFYNDAWRLAVYLPLFGAVAFGVFACYAGAWLSEKYNHRLPAKLRTPATGTLVGALVIGLVALLLTGAYVGRNTDRIALQYHDGPAVTYDERAAYHWLAEHTEPDELVMNDLRDGSVWMYAVAGVHPMEWTFYGNLDEKSPQTYLTKNLNKLNTDPKVRVALDELKIRYVLVGSGHVREAYQLTSGLFGLRWTDGFRQVFKNDGAIVYEIAGQENVRSTTRTSGASPTTPGN
ncbi:MAG: DUF6541 family protein [Kibdelosporangium sp.]